MVKIRFFASLKDLVGEAEMEMDVRGNTSVRQIFQQLKTRFPGLERYESVLMVAVNREYTGLDASVVGGDEVAFFPPVSGGAR